MKTKVLFVGFILICFTSNVAFAQDISHKGDQLLWGLTGKETGGEVRAAVCQTYYTGYLSGIIDSYGILSDVYPKIKFICLSKQGISNDQASQIVIKYLQAHPERLHESARILIFDALADAFPCFK